MEQVKLKERLYYLARQGTLSHAYIFEGKKDGIKAAFAEEFAKAITSFHEDITVIKAEGLSIKDRDVESIQARLSMKPMSGDRNVAVINDADTMTVRAQNRLLKTLEEPPGESVIILLSENVENLLPTILSRCVIYRIEDEVRDAGGIIAEAEEYACKIGSMLLEGKGYYIISRQLDWVTENRDHANAFLDCLEKWIRDLIIASAGIEIGISYDLNNQNESIEKDKAYNAVKLIEEARRDLSRNINIGYAIKSMILKMM